jgi:hypothetical protein
MPKAQLPAERGDRVEVYNETSNYHEKQGTIVGILPDGTLQVNIDNLTLLQPLMFTPDEVILLVD